MLAKPPDPGSWNPQSDGATDVRKEFRQIRRITTVRNAPEWRTLEHSRTFAQILSQSLPAATLRRQPLFCFSFPPQINFATNMWNHTLCTFCGWLLFTYPHLLSSCTVHHGSVLSSSLLSNTLPLYILCFIQSSFHRY